MANLDAVKAQILAMFPVGSRWYDCLRDQTGEVAFHFPPRGIVLVSRFTATHFPVLQPERQKTVWDRVRRCWTLNAYDFTREPQKRDHVEIMRYSYSDLLDGRLVEPAQDSEAAGELFYGYKKRRWEIDSDFERMRLEAGFAEAEMRGHPRG